MKRMLPGPCVLAPRLITILDWAADPPSQSPTTNTKAQGRRKCVM